MGSVRPRRPPAAHLRPDVVDVRHQYTLDLLDIGTSVLLYICTRRISNLYLGTVPTSPALRTHRPRSKLFEAGADRPKVSAGAYKNSSSLRPLDNLSNLPQIPTMEKVGEADPGSKNSRR